MDSAAEEREYAKQELRLGRPLVLPDARGPCIREHCGRVSSETLAYLKTLPEWHPDWDRRIGRANLDVPETSRVQVHEGAERLALQELGDSQA